MNFHGYTILPTGVILGKSGEPLKQQKSPRNGGGHDMTVQLYYRGKVWKWRVSRLVLSAFDGPMHGYEAGHDDRNPENNDITNLNKELPKENQAHWRADEKRR